MKASWTYRDFNQWHVLQPWFLWQEFVGIPWRIFRFMIILWVSHRWFEWIWLKKGFCLVSCKFALHSNSNIQRIQWACFLFCYVNSSVLCLKINICVRYAVYRLQYLFYKFPLIACVPSYVDMIEQSNQNRTVIERISR
jgi:hypothetical protein